MDKTRSPTFATRRLAVPFLLTIAAASVVAPAAAAPPNPTRSQAHWPPPMRTGEVAPAAPPRLHQRDCPDYTSWAVDRGHRPLSKGRNMLPMQRPEPDCRTFVIDEVEETIAEMRRAVADPDLFRLFENCFPNTLDTAVKWQGLAAQTKLPRNLRVGRWLRDSANQLQSYKSLLRATPSRGSLASLFRGTINMQARFIEKSPHCNAFRAPPESGISTNMPISSDYVWPIPDKAVVFECKWELDSLAAFLQLSHEYYEGTGDLAFFGKHGWVDAIEAIMNTTTALQAGTYTEEGLTNASPYRFQRQTSTASETLSNSGDGNPVVGGTGLVRSAFRPSDDATIYQLLVPANMMFSRYLASCAEIMARLADDTRDYTHGSFRRSLARDMSALAEQVRRGIEKHAKVRHHVYGEMYAYEIDGSGSHNLMDDANLPSLLSSAMMGFVSTDDATYLNTRKFIFSKDNPYFMHGPFLNGTGGPHIGPGMAWPMSLIVRIMTTDDDDEIMATLRQLVESTDGLGLMHEAVNTFSASMYTRPWFSWANGLFGQMMLDLKSRKPHILKTVYFQ
ncbi:hypothetical protein PpBr36_08447 [Pyricularia pennisetigena]|uniref:hypothetical protein n=1 Tax=Pyricularia pennisetigena TaxID=1578925 RepID=UPI001150BF20|nr:hypothetical protein PpBr36_08447 [Pyricularia pennisetigena]TLS24247.1 hypothetical protein PpBr36_08447 [Pyricularia pennisetigena]